MAANINEMVQVRPIDSSSAEASSHQNFEGVQKSLSMGNRRPIAFGGCVLSQCISAGFASLGPPSKRPKYELYSAMGNFLGPGATEILTQYEVEDVRTTKTFATRIVTAWQDWSKLPEQSELRKAGAPPAAGGRRRIMITILDFQVREKNIMMHYSPSPLYIDDHNPNATFLEKVHPFYSHPSEIPPNPEYIRQTFSPIVVKRFESTFTLFDRFYKMRAVKNSMGMQKALGLDSARKTTQDDLPLQQRNNCSWYTLPDGVVPDDDKGEGEAALGFVMDGALAFLPLTFTHRFLLDAAACSSLEFSLRFMTPIKWISSEGKQNWFLQEQCTEAGSNGRTFSTGRMWDTDGNLIAVMTQMGIMRGNEPLDAERAKL